ncbi:hypothetical protein LTR08_005849 [Meristemomyces frigidus]|nr:hypothetical protein LTR08_005849 [Meristemomyces frigidus]
MATSQLPGLTAQPPSMGGALRHQHPRRPPAHRSVSLIHSPAPSSPPIERERSEYSSASERSSSQDPVQFPPVDSPAEMNSSCESSNAEQWFEKSNNNVCADRPSYVDNEPPFCMRNNSSSTGTSPASQRHFTNAKPSSSLSFRAALPDLGDHAGSIEEDFRDVIDDLTVENKKLKRRLKEYEKLHDAHLTDEKLFELRVYGLPGEKKRELEETLRDFTSSLGTKTGLPPLLMKEHTASTQTSLSNTDSAYASTSASGEAGSSRRSASGNRRNEITPTLASRRQHMQFFPHQTPGHILPQPNPATVNERSKKRLIVRRLEQLFAEKGAGADSVRYMRHLGIPPPDSGSSRSPEEGHGWIYLNLLINMAQLHTLNITTDFICTALREHSENFEIAPDCRMVRWKGGRHVSSSGAALTGSMSEDVDDAQSPRKRQKLSQDVSSHPQPQRGATQHSHSESNKLVYTPMFSHEDSTGSSDDTSSEGGEYEASSRFPAAVGDDSSGVTRSLVRTTQTESNKMHDVGPTTFYDNAKFCTDLDLTELKVPHASPFAPESTGDNAPIIVEATGTGALPAAAPQPFNSHFTASNEEENEDDQEYDDDDSDAESDSSLDLLASAREVDPEAISAREREYDADMAERLADEIPTGRSAATAGGGSGFPFSDFRRQAWRVSARDESCLCGVPSGSYEG